MELMSHKSQIRRLQHVCAVIGVVTLVANASRLQAGVPHARIQSPGVITITARDFAFDAPDSILAGITTINLVNRGPDLHQAQLVKLAAGKTLADVQKVVRTGGSLPAWMVMAGGPNAVAPGHQSSATLNLAPGNYALLCLITGADGWSHAKNGMVRQLTVAGLSMMTVFPGADLTLTLRDDGIAMPATLTPGHRVIRVSNASRQPHEVAFVKLAPGRTAQQMVDWLDGRQGPPPGELRGGLAGAAPNVTAQFTVDLEPGEYAFLCHLTDAKGGKQHDSHGMLAQFTVGRGAAATR